MIQVRNLTKSFDNKNIVDSISFDVNDEDTLVLLGRSGCGKTTILKMINRLIEPSSGEIIINGENIKGKDPDILRRNIGYVIQSIGLFPHFTVEQNIAVVPKLLKWEKEKIKSRVKELLELVGLPSEEFANRNPLELSGGQRQRVGIARALAADPALVLLDEPFGALDPITRVQIRKEFKRLESIIRKTMIMVTHDIFEAFELGDKICLIEAGKIQQIGTPNDLYYNPANDFVKEFIQSHCFDIEEFLE